MKKKEIIGLSFFSILTIPPTIFTAILFLTGTPISSFINVMKKQIIDTENIVNESLHEVGPIILTIGKKGERVDHIFAVITDKQNKQTIQLITPSPAETKKKIDTSIDEKIQNSLLQLFSGSSDANASHCRDDHLACSGNLIMFNGFLIPHCWCKS